MRELFPVLRDVRITHRWGGPLGIARDWHASVGLDRARPGWPGPAATSATASSTTNLAGRTLADLITGGDSELTAAAVGRAPLAAAGSPNRCAGWASNAGLQAMTWADRAERRSGRASRVASAVDAIMAR